MDEGSMVPRHEDVPIVIVVIGGRRSVACRLVGHIPSQYIREGEKRLLLDIGGFIPRVIRQIVVVTATRSWWFSVIPIKDGLRTIKALYQPP